MRVAAVMPRVQNARAVRAAVCSLVDVLKVAGWPIEAILIAVKNSAIEPDSLFVQPIIEPLISPSVQWSIEHYYRGVEDKIGIN
ncbi:MAG: hypothetical protein ACREPM_01080 [Gemmatimonadaceae bacterium]